MVVSKIEMRSSIESRLQVRLRSELPYPIASSFKRLGACPEDNSTRLRYILQTAEMTARLLGIVALAEVRRAAPAQRLPGDELARKLQTPSFGTWIAILREGLAALHANGSTLFLPELDAFYFDQKRKPTAAARRLDELCTMRNRFAHDDVPPDAFLRGPEIPAACETSVAALLEVLKALSYFGERPLMVASPVLVSKRRGKAPRYERHKIMMVGCLDSFDIDKDTVGEVCETAEALLLDTTTNTYLNLDPLVVYSEDGFDERPDVDGVMREVRTNIPDVFLYNGGRPGNRKYIACNRGGTFATKGRPDAAEVDAQIDEIVTLASTPRSS